MIGSDSKVLPRKMKKSVENIARFMSDTSAAPKVLTTNGTAFTFRFCHMIITRVRCWVSWRLNTKSGARQPSSRPAIITNDIQMLNGKLLRCRSARRTQFPEVQKAVRKRRRVRGRSNEHGQAFMRRYWRCVNGKPLKHRALRD